MPLFYELFITFAPKLYHCVVFNDYEIEIISTYKLFDTPVFKIDDKVTIKYLITDMKPNKKEIKEALSKFKIITLVKELIKSKKI